MKMTELKHFQLKKIVGPDWKTLDESQREQIISSIKLNIGFERIEPNRYGFVHCYNLDNYCIYGIFAQEVEEEYYSYNPTSMDHVRKDYYPFVDFIFIILIDKGICLLQNRGKLPSKLKMCDVENNFQHKLKKVFVEIKIPFDKLEELEFVRQKEEFIKVFKECRIVSIEVDSLREKTIPEYFKFYNPDFDKDKIIRNFLNNDYLSHTDGTTLRSGKNKEDLGESKFAAAILHAGDPKIMEYTESKETHLPIEKINPKKISRKIGPIIDLKIDVSDTQGRISIEGLKEQSILSVLIDINSMIMGGEEPLLPKEKDKQIRLI